MISNIIQKEKERQEVYLSGKAEMKDYAGWSCEVHRQSLINLKEYMEGEFRFLEDSEEGDLHTVPYIKALSEDRRLDSGYKYAIGLVLKEFQGKIVQLKEDIKELTKMIERYK